MTKWTDGGVALPSRKDVPTPAGQGRPRVRKLPYAKPGSGFMPGYNDVQKAFQDAFTDQIQKKTFDAGPVIDSDQGGDRRRRSTVGRTSAASRTSATSASR